MQNKGLLEDFRRALPDFPRGIMSGRPIVFPLRCRQASRRSRRACGSPQISCAAEHSSNSRFCAEPCRSGPSLGPRAPRIFHLWRQERPQRDAASFYETGGNVCACGRDPYFPARPDVLQLNSFEPGLRAAVIETISEIATQCDGIRCDMAMLLLNIAPAEQYLLHVSVAYGTPH